EESDGPMRIEDLAREISELHLENIINDLNHVLRSFKYKGVKIKIFPATCRKCGFKFKSTKWEINIPHRCPRCKSELIDPPIIQKRK
ncbi:MAG: transcriptional regulator, partial [Promethearchaeota archaeon]